MTRVCLVGVESVNLREQLLEHAGARQTLAPYELLSPWQNTIAVNTVSLGTAVSLLNDLDWYLRRYVSESLIFEPTLTSPKWVSRNVATAIRNRELSHEETGDLLKIFGIVDGRLVEPMYAQRVDDHMPSYDLRDVDETLVVRITEDEFG